MKLLRIGSKGKEKPAVIDKEGKIRDISSYIKDFEPETLNFEQINKLKEINLDTLPEFSNSERVGACISNPRKFIAIGLNYIDHAKETGAKPPSEPIVFMKATSSISGPFDNIEIHKDSKKLDWWWNSCSREWTGSPRELVCMDSNIPTPCSKYNIDNCPTDARYDVLGNFLLIKRENKNLLKKPQKRVFQKDF